MRSMSAVIVTATLVAAAASAQDAGKNDRRLLQGTWLLVEQVIDGTKSPSELLERDEYRMVIEGDNFTNTKSGKEVLVRGTQALDPSRSPKTINRTFTEGDSKGETYPGIYKLEDGTLTICFAQSDDKRPTDFESPARSGRILLVFKRASK